MNEKIKLIYISGIGRSGSTLIDLIISTDPKVFSVGEIYKFNKIKKENIPCNCGKNFSNCSFWKDFYYSKYKIKNRINLIDYIKTINFIFNPFIKKINFRKKSQNYSLLKKIKEKTSSKYILDSSKDIARLIELDSNPFIEVYNISIIREAEEVANSFSSRKNKNKKNYFISLLKWNFINYIIVKYLKKRDYSKNLVIDYEEFCKNPKKGISSIEDFLQIKIPKEYVKKIRSMEHHGLAQNRISQKEKRKKFEGISLKQYNKKRSTVKKLLEKLLTYPSSKIKEKLK